MARSPDYPFPPRVSIAWLARRWANIGVSKRFFIETAVHEIVLSDPGHPVHIFNQGSTTLGEYLAWVGERAVAYPDPIGWAHRRIAEEVLWEPSQVASIIAATGVPPPPGFEAWAASAIEPPTEAAPNCRLDPPPPPGGRPTLRSAIQAAFEDLSLAEQRQPRKRLYDAIRRDMIRRGIVPAVNNGAVPPGLSDTAIRDALRAVKEAERAET